MTLNIQIVGILFSLLYGFLFSLFIGINYKMIYNANIYIKIISSLFIVMIGTLVYFIFLKNITSGAFHIYFGLVFFIGCYVESVISTKLAKALKK
jgi:membrane protein CcdC involved in cytochrome C biogenesis